MHHISEACRGEVCHRCSAPATHKIGEEILFDDPNPIRHNLTAYICCDCFMYIFRHNSSCQQIQGDITTDSKSSKLLS